MESKLHEKHLGGPNTVSLLADNRGMMQGAPVQIIGSPTFSEPLAAGCLALACPRAFMI